MACGPHRGARAKVTPRCAVRPCPCRCDRYGSFSRSLPLPADANADDVKASYDHGILTVSVGLKAEKKDEVKKIEVKPAK